jgi:hypothetical protein
MMEDGFLISSDGCDIPIPFFIFNAQEPEMISQKQVLLVLIVIQVAVIIYMIFWN